jgi:hypothetical protein
MADNDSDDDLEYTIEPPDTIPSTMIEILYCRAYEPDMFVVRPESQDGPIKKKKKKDDVEE